MPPSLCNHLPRLRFEDAPWGLLLGCICISTSPSPRTTPLVPNAFVLSRNHAESVQPRQTPPRIAPLAAMTENGATEMMPRQKGRPVRDIETDYQPVNWKRLFLAPKYLGMHTAHCLAVRRGTRNPPLRPLRTRN